MRVLLLIALASCWRGTTPPPAKATTITPRAEKPPRARKDGCEMAIDDIRSIVENNVDKFSGSPVIDDSRCDDSDLDWYWFCLSDYRLQAYVMLSSAAYWAIYYCSDPQ